MSIPTPPQLLTSRTGDPSLCFALCIVHEGAEAPGCSHRLSRAMSLQPPRDETLNGLLQGYRIYYRELEFEAGSGLEAKTPKSPSALRAELTGECAPCPGTRHARLCPSTGMMCSCSWRTNTHLLPQTGA